MASKRDDLLIQLPYAVHIIQAALHRLYLAQTLLSTGYAARGTWYCDKRFAFLISLLVCTIYLLEK